MYWALRATLSLCFQLLPNQWNKSTKKSSMLSFDIPLNDRAPLFAVLYTLWLGQPLVNVDEIYFLTRVIVEFLLPMLTAVLSIPKTTQFSHDTPASEINLALLSNKATKL